MIYHRSSLSYTRVTGSVTIHNLRTVAPRYGELLAGLWNKEFAPVDPSTAKSRSGSIIFYAGCPVSWASKLQSQVAFSTTEAEYIAMSQALRDVIPVMNLLQEMREQEFQVICNEPHVYCKVFEDNSGAL